jgi:hypothetical protein
MAKRKSRRKVVGTPGNAKETTRGKVEAEEDCEVASRSRAVAGIAKPTSLRHRAWRIIVVLSTLGSLFGFLVLKPDVAIGLPRYLSDSDPFSARFDVVNHGGFLPMKDVQFSCALNRATTALRNTFDRSFILGKHYDSISSGETVTVACPLSAVAGLGGIRSADITVFVS